jgi:hypothetical protein
MTTDPTRPALPSASDEPTAATAGPGRRARRHAATGGRILAGSLSAAAALGLMGAMADVTSQNSDPTAPPAGAPAQPTVIVVRRPAAVTDAVVPAVQRVAPAAAPPVTTSHAS